jgi:hypothetical protein
MSHKAFTLTCKGSLPYSPTCCQCQPEPREPLHACQSQGTFTSFNCFLLSLSYCHTQYCIVSYPSASSKQFLLFRPPQSTSHLSDTQSTPSSSHLPGPGVTKLDAVRTLNRDHILQWHLHRSSWPTLSSWDGQGHKMAWTGILSPKP